MYEVYGSERAPTTCCRFWVGRFRSTNILGFARTRCGYHRNAPQRATRAESGHPRTSIERLKLILSEPNTLHYASARARPI